jgi:hypothetical protein|tara:strand:- start:641 stop:835 length:195 start_codon:yes stop_codon:yes gene_type:complete
MKIAGICKSHGYYKGQNCSECKIVPKKESPYFFMRSDIGSRTDIESTPITLDESVDIMRGQQYV